MGEFLLSFARGPSSVFSEVLPDVAEVFWPLWCILWWSKSMPHYFVLLHGAGALSGLLAARSSPVPCTGVMNLISDPGPVHRLLQKGVCGARAAHQRPVEGLAVG